MCVKKSNLTQEIIVYPEKKHCIVQGDSRMLFPMLSNKSSVVRLFLGLFLVSIVVTQCQEDSQQDEVLFYPFLIDESLYETHYENSPIEFSVNDVAISENILEVSISFLGGCVEHEFSLIGTEFFIKTYPVKSEVFILHDPHNDQCETELNNTLHFDLTPLKILYQANGWGNSGAIVIIVKGSSDTVEYEF